MRGIKDAAADLLAVRRDNGQASGIDGNDAARAAHIPVFAFAGNTVRPGHFNLPQAPRDRVIGVIQMQIAPDALFFPEVWCEFVPDCSKADDSGRCPCSKAHNVRGEEECRGDFLGGDS